MSYIQVQAGGKARGLKFNRMAQLIFAEKAVSDNIIACLYALVYSGLRACSYAKDEPVDYTFEDVCDWVDGLSNEDVEKINVAFQETEMYKSGQAYLSDIEEAKKKDIQNQPSQTTEQKV